MKTSEYKFHSDDRALIQGPLDKLLWNPIERLIPSWVKPNAITLLSVFFMLLSAFFVWMAFKGAGWGFLAASVCVFLYMGGDCVDGIHARSTGQSSRMGEFLDHWLDSINALIINLCIVAVFNLQGWILILYMTSFTIALFATIWKQQNTGIFYRAKVGSSDALVMIVILYIMMFFFYKTPLFTYQGPMIINIASGFVYLTIIVGIITTIIILLSVGKNFQEFIPIMLAMIAVSAWELTVMMGRFHAGLLIYGVNIPLHGRYILSRLGNKKSPYRNWIISFMAVLGIVILFVKDSISFPVESYMIYISLLLIFLTSFRDLFRAISVLFKSENPKKS